MLWSSQIISFDIMSSTVLLLFMYWYYNRMEKKELQTKKTFILTFTYVVTFYSILYLCGFELAHCLVSFHFSLKDCSVLLVGQVFYNRFSVFVFFFCEFSQFSLHFWRIDLLPTEFLIDMLFFIFLSTLNMSSHCFLASAVSHVIQMQPFQATSL